MALTRTACGSLVLILLMLAGLPEGLAATKWIHLRSAHLEAVSEASEEEAKRRLVVMERFRGVMSRGLFGRRVSGLPTRVLLLDGSQGVTRLLAGEGSSRPARFDGSFIAGPDENLILVNQVGDHFKDGSISQHEFAHLLMRYESGNWPVWLAEGVALCFEKTEWREGKAVFGVADRFVGTPLVKSPLMPWDDFLDFDRRKLWSMPPEKGRLFYGQSWVLTHLLLFGLPPSRRDEVDRFFDLVDRRVPSGEALKQALGWDSEKAKAEVRRYMKSGRFSTIAVDVPADQDLHVEATEAPAGMGESWIACFEAQSVRLDSAGQWLARARGAGGETAWTLLVEGEIALGSGNGPAAAEAFRRSIRLDPTLSKARLALVEALAPEISEASVDVLDEVLEQLERVVGQHPEHDIAWAMTGVCHLRRERPEKAALAFAEALKRNPRNWDARYHLALLRSRVGLKDLALAGLRDVAERCPDPKLAELARQGIEEAKRR